MNSMPPIRDIIASLLHDRDVDKPDIPDGFVDLSDAIAPLRLLTFNGRALRSADNYSIGQMLGRLVAAYLPTNPSKEDLERCILGLLVLNAQLMRSVPAQHPDMSLEEFLLEAVHQDAIAHLRETFTTIAVNSHISPSGVDVAQHPVFRDAIPLTDEAIKGFIDRQILAHELGFTFELIDTDEPLLTPTDTPSRKVTFDEQAEFSHEGFDEFYDIYFSHHPDDDNEE